MLVVIFSTKIKERLKSFQCHRINVWNIHTEKVLKYICIHYRFIDQLAKKRRDQQDSKGVQGIMTAPPPHSLPVKPSTLSNG
jgi:hypothetical protein